MQDGKAIQSQTSHPLDLYIATYDPYAIGDVLSAILIKYQVKFLTRCSAKASCSKFKGNNTNTDQDESRAKHLLHAVKRTIR